MRISKRRLKRIIREEYTLLKRKGLIRESRRESAINFHRREMGGMEDRSLDRIDDMRMFLDDLMMRQPDLEFDQYAVMEILSNEFPEASEEEIMEAMDSF